MADGCCIHHYDHTAGTILSGGEGTDHGYTSTRNGRASITLTSGILSHKPMAGSAEISPVNAGLEGFARAAALEALRGIRVNVVSPVLGDGNPQGAEHGPEPWQTRGRGGEGLR